MAKWGKEMGTTTVGRHSIERLKLLFICRVFFKWNDNYLINMHNYSIYWWWKDGSHAYKNLSELIKMYLTLLLALFNGDNRLGQPCINDHSHRIDGGAVISWSQAGCFFCCPCLLFIGSTVAGWFVSGCECGLSRG